MNHDATRKSAEPDLGEASEPVSARVVRQVLRTPAFREILHLHLSEVGRGEARAVVRALLREDPEVGLGVASVTPRLIDTVTESLVELGREVANMPPALLDAYVDQVVRDLDAGTLREAIVVWAPILARALPGALNAMFDTVAGAAAALGSLEPPDREAALRRLLSGADGERMAAAINGLAALGIQVVRDHPTLVAGDEGPDWTALVQGIDHGKLREALAALSGLTRRGAESVAQRWLADPVAVANLVLLVPVLVNDAVRLGSFVVDRLDLPDEVLASAIFNVLREVDLAALAGLINGAAQTISVLHLGSRTLGREEPAFQAVFARLLDGLVESLDWRALSDAVVALGEDGDVMARVVARRLTTDPTLLAEVMRTVSSLANVALSAGREVFLEVEQLPGATLEDLSGRLPNVEPRAVGELLSQGLAALSRWDRTLGQGRWLDEAVAALDWEVVGELLWRCATPAILSYVESGWRQHRDRPEVVGTWVNGVLERFNRYVADNPERVATFAPRLLSEVSSREVAQAVRTAGRLLGGAVYATAQTQPLVQTLLSPPWRRWSGK